MFLVQYKFGADFAERLLKSLRAVRAKVKKGSANAILSLVDSRHSVSPRD